MDSKNLCLMATFLSFIFSLQVMGVLAPFMSTPLLFLGWMISAVYLKLLPFRQWLKARIIWDATKLGVFYIDVVEVYHNIIQLKTWGELFLVGTITKHMMPNWAPEEVLNATLIMNKGVDNIRSINPLWALSLPVLSLIITYSVIGVIYIYLRHIGFYRRILI